MPIRPIPEGFHHPGNKTFDECERNFKTSTYADGSVLFYTPKNLEYGFINDNFYQKRVDELYKICSTCPKFEGCLVHETLLDVISLTQKKIDSKK